MKTVLLCLILFCTIVLPSLGELTEADPNKIQLTEADLNKIRLIVKEEINTKIESFEKDIKEYINTENENIEKQITLLTNFVYGLIALIVAAVAIPQVIMAWRSGKNQEQELSLEALLTRRMEEHIQREERIDAIRRQVETLTQEMETVKQQQQEVNP